MVNVGEERSSKEDMTYLIVRIPREWKTLLRRRVIEMGYIDMSEWLRDVIRAAIGIEPARAPLPIFSQGLGTPQKLNARREGEGILERGAGGG